MRKLPALCLLVVVTALIVSACGGGPAPAPSGGGQPAASATAVPSNSQAPAQQPAAAQPTAKPADQQPPADSSNSNATDLLELTDVTEGLASLNSYESTFAMSFKGTDSGQPKEWTWAMTEQFVKDPPAKHTTISGMGTAITGTDSSIETIEVGGKSYSRIGTMCASSDATEAPTANTGFTPSSVIGDIKAAQLLGTDSINGISAQHYAVDINSLTALGAYTNGKSEVWVAQPGNFVVKYSFEATGKDTFFGGGANTEGTISWNYELKSVNQPIVIEPPKDCGGAPADIPVMADATDQSAFGTMTTYSSASAFDDVVAFYKKEMVANGWTAQEGGLSQPGVMSILTFTKDKRTASITLSFDDSKKVTTVMISIEGQ